MKDMEMFIKDFVGELLGQPALKTHNIKPWITITWKWRFDENDVSPQWLPELYTMMELVC